jgi:hypothetical protein
MPRCRSIGGRIVAASVILSIVGDDREGAAHIMMLPTEQTARERGLAFSLSECNSNRCRVMQPAHTNGGSREQASM